METELLALEANKTWQLTDLPPDKEAIKCKYVFKVKYNSDGSLERYKALLVAKGYTQIEGMNYHETFSPVAKMVTVKCLISITAIEGWILHQFDVNNAFLHDDLQKEIFIHKPPGYSRGGPHQVCRLLKTFMVLRRLQGIGMQNFLLLLLGMASPKARLITICLLYTPVLLSLL